MMCCTPILKLPDFYRSFVLRTGASDKGISAVLLQEYDGEYLPVAYAGKKLTPTQAAYAIVERECLATVWVLKEFTTYLTDIRYPNRPSTFGFARDNPIKQSEINPMGVEVGTVST